MLGHKPLPRKLPSAAGLTFSSLLLLAGLTVSLPISVIVGFSQLPVTL